MNRLRSTARRARDADTQAIMFHFNFAEADIVKDGRKIPDQFCIDPVFRITHDVLRSLLFVWLSVYCASFKAASMASS